MMVVFVCLPPVPSWTTGSLINPNFGAGTGSGAGGRVNVCVTLRSRAARLPVDPAVYVVTDRGIAGNRGVVPVVREALSAGARIVQLRDKEVPRSDSIALGRELRMLTLLHDALLIVNDDVELALELGADGVHVGQEDALAGTVLARMRSSGNYSVRILGVSCGTSSEARQAVADGASYLGVGSVYSTQSKSDAGAPIGPGGLQEVVAATADAAADVPVIAIGGVNGGNAEECGAHGAEGVAVISAVMAASDVGGAIRGIDAALQKGRLAWRKTAKMRNRT